MPHSTPAGVAVAPVKNSFAARCKLPARKRREELNGGKVELGEGFRCGCKGGGCTGNGKRGIAVIKNSSSSGSNNAQSSNATQ